LDREKLDVLRDCLASIPTDWDSPKGFFKEIPAFPGISQNCYRQILH
jgi:hypothetical protein